MKKKKIKDHYKEALRYLENADNILKNNTTINNLGFYNDAKYVKMAGHTAWAGVLVALDPLHKPLGKGKRKSVDTYRDVIKGKFMNVYNSAYNYLHLYMGYDGELSTVTKKTGFEYAKILIEWAKKQYPKNITGTPPLKKPCKKCGTAFVPEYKRIVNCKKCRR